MFAQPHVHARSARVRFQCQRCDARPARADGCVPLQDFLDAAAAFANDELFGTLSCGVAVHPSLHADAPEALHAFVASLRYGCVGINVSPALCFNLPQAPWGAHAAAGTPEDIGSGNVLTHSTMYDHAEKAVAWYPFTMYPKPLWCARWQPRSAPYHAYSVLMSQSGPASSRACTCLRLHVCSATSHLPGNPSAFTLLVQSSNQRGARAGCQALQTWRPRCGALHASTVSATF